METYTGNVEITKKNEKEWQEKLRGVKKITGNVAIYGNAEAEFPLLAEVGGYVAIYSSVEFPLLAEVGGYVAVYSSVEAEFPLLAEIGGYVDVYGSAEFPLLAEVGGDVLVSGNAEAEFPLLAEIGGNVAVYSSVEFPLLAEIGGYVDVYGSAEFPLLAEVGGNVLVSGNAKAEFPLLAKVGGNVAIYGSAKVRFLRDYKSNVGNNLRIRIMTKLTASFKNKGYLFADNILSKIISKRKAGNIMFWKTRAIGSMKIIYVAQKGNIFSHGETPAKASHDLRYKLTDRDTTKYEGWTLSSSHAQEAIIGAYRAITGACETGVKMFCEGKKLPAKMSIEAAITATKGQYRADQFAAFFKK